MKIDRSKLKKSSSEVVINLRLFPLLVGGDVVDLVHYLCFYFSFAAC